MKIILTILLLICLSGCETRYVAIPAALTKHCTIGEVQEQSVDEAVRVATLRRTSVEICNDHLDRIKAIQGTVIK
jgi:hypothetical protein